MLSSKTKAGGFLVAACLPFALWASHRVKGNHRRQDPFEVSIAVDAGKPLGPMKPMWRFFGADEPNYATMKNGSKLIGELGRLDPRQVFFRTHNLLTTGDGKPALKWGSTNAYTEDAAGNPIYNWKILDGIFDTYLKRGVRPYVQIGFMPEALSTKPEPYQHHWTPTAKYDEIYTGWTYPPKDYKKWGELVYQWANHCVERYGEDEVAKWYWEVWNEPNIGYWHGTREEFYKLQGYAVAAVRRALPRARVGGPDMAGSDPRFLKAFLDYCLSGDNPASGKQGSPLDFVSFHAKGAPTFVDGHVRMGLAAQLKGINQGFQTIASYPQFKSKPIVIGESDPDGCAACQGPQLGYRNGTMYSSYTADSFARAYELADRHGVNLEGELTWAFEFEDQPFFAGFRALASNGLDLPVLNVFRMFSKMSGQRVSTQSSGGLTLDEILDKGVRDRPDVSALASIDNHKCAVMVWHYADDDIEGPPAAIDLKVDRLPVQHGTVMVDEYRIDEQHSNAFTTWQKMGSPQQPSLAEYKKLEAAGQLQQSETQQKLKVEDGVVQVKAVLPRKAISLFILSWH